MSGPADIRELTSKNTHNVVAEMLLREPGCGVIMDIPCGKGAFAKRMAEKGVNIVAADCSGDPGLPGVRYVEANMDRPLSLADGELDAVACIDGIEHIERQFDFIRECRRVIRPGGCIVISTPNISSLRSRARWLATGFHNKGKTPLDETNPNPMHHINLISFSELRLSAAHERIRDHGGLDKPHQGHELALRGPRAPRPHHDAMGLPQRGTRQAGTADMHRGDGADAVHAGAIRRDADRESGPPRLAIC